MRYKSDSDTLNSFDEATVRNLRSTYGERLREHSDVKVAQAWIAFSDSDDYYVKGQPDFPLWCDMDWKDLR
jgi:hypothetical protein